MSVTGQAETDGSGFLPEEDTIEYRLYSLEEDESLLAKLAVECSQLTQQITREHIWHYDRFSLEVCAGKRDSLPACLYGRSCFRDNVEDEWLIVYLLYSISRLYTNLVISVRDSDGQLLLIEAAHKLPSWLTPETAANRVFIHKGQLHIIPKPRSPAEITSLPVYTPTIQDAVHIVGDDSIPTLASEPVQRCILERLKKFSENIGSDLHYTHCYVPLPVAHVMSHDPQLVSAAVHALCDRDPLDMQACQRMVHFSPREHAMLMTGVKFTKCLYAQLLHQRFSSPRNNGFNLPPVGNQRYKACELGMKLTCGLEILISRVKHGVSSDSETAGGGEEDADPCKSLDGDPRWLKFLESLQSKGFFQNEMEGSKLYQQLLSSAKEYFVSHLLDESDTPPLNCLMLAGRKVMHILQSVPFSEDELTEQSKKLKPADDDSWLYISPEELEVMMKKAAGYLPSDISQAPSSQPSTQSASKQPTASEIEGKISAGDEDLDLQSMVYGMKSFVDKISSHEGAELPWTGKADDEVNFDPDSVLDMMKTMLNSTDRERPASPDNSRDRDEDNFSVSEESSDEDEEMADRGGEMEEMEEIMEEMDREISVTEVGKSFEKMKVGTDPEEEEGNDSGVGGALQPVDVDFNLIKNLLESYTSQEGGAGPASNILQSLGIHIPEQDST